MLVIAMQDEGSLPTTTEQMDADTGREDPAGRGVLDGLPRLVGERRLMVLERFAEAIFQGRIDQQAARHDHQQRHAPLGLLARAGGGQQAWDLARTERRVPQAAGLDTPPAGPGVVPGARRVRWWRGGHNAGQRSGHHGRPTTRSARRSAGTPPGQVGVWAGAPPRAIARP